MNRTAFVSACRGYTPPEPGPVRFGACAGCGPWPNTHNNRHERSWYIYYPTSHLLSNVGLKPQPNKRETQVFPPNQNMSNSVGILMAKVIDLSFQNPPFTRSCYAFLLLNLRVHGICLCLLVQASSSFCISKLEVQFCEAW